MHIESSQLVSYLADEGIPGVTYLGRCSGRLHWYKAGDSVRKNALRQSLRVKPAPHPA